jgi:hypothetical protein
MLAKAPPRSLSLPGLFHEPGKALQGLSISAVEAELTHGSHRPLLCQMEGPDGPVGRWIVKPSGRHPHGNLALLRELAGASVAAWVGLLVPAIELTRFPERAVPAWADSSLTGRILREHAGQFAFCSRYLQASRLEQGALLARDASDALALEALRLLVLDVLLWHYDRTPTNPNALCWQGHVVAIDHDTAFRDIQALDESTGLGVNVGALSFRGTGWGMHLAFPLLSLRSSLAVEAARQVTDRMEALDDEVLLKWLAQWPDELERSWFDAPTGYKSDLFRFLGVRREKASILWSEFLAARLEPEPPSANEEEP